MGRKWVKGANGLWTSYDPVIQRQVARAKAKAEREAMKVGVEE